MLCLARPVKNMTLNFFKEKNGGSVTFFFYDNLLREVDTNREIKFKSRQQKYFCTGYTHYVLRATLKSNDF